MGWQQGVEVVSEVRCWWPVVTLARTRWDMATRGDGHGDEDGQRGQADRSID